MRAYQVTELGKAPSVTDIPVPKPGPGQVQIRIAACGLNFGDLLMVKGTYQETPEPPFVPGMEVSGTVAALGDGVQGLSVGDRIAVFGGHGGFAEYGCYDAERCIPIPDGMSFEHAAAFIVAYGTSHLALSRRARLQAGETLLVLGAAGGVGLTAVEIGKKMGARVIAVARGAEKLKVAQAAGADHLIDSTTQDIREEVKKLGGADVVYDPVGGDQFKAALRACNPEARVLIIGFASGEVPQVPANIILVKNVTIIGYYWGGYMAFNPKPLTDSLREMMTWYAEGKISPHVSHAIPLERAEEAFELMRSRKSTGKVVVTMPR